MAQFPFNSDVFFDDPETEPYRIFQAIRDKAYGDLFYLLGMQTEPLEPSVARNLAARGLDCPLRVFQKILDYCPPVAEFANCTPGPKIFDIAPYSVVSEAAVKDRPAHLDELLRRGADPNGDGVDGSAPLAAALEGRSTRCVKRLLQEPGLNCSPNETLLNAWAKVGLEDTEKFKRCCRMIAPRLSEQAGEPLTFRGVPVPRQMTPSIALAHYNWPLVTFLCRRGLSEKEGLRLLDKLSERLRDELKLSLYRGALRWRWRPCPSDAGPALLRRDLAALLDAVFTACPQLLRRRQAQTLLFFTVLAGKRTPPELRPWLEQVRGPTVALHFSLGVENLCLVLPFWRERLGDRWIPALDPRSNLCWDPSRTPQTLETLFAHCRVLRFRPGKELTRLSRLTVHAAPMPLLLEQLRPGGLLNGEDPRVLLDYCDEALKKEDASSFCVFFDSLDLSFPMTRQRWQAVLLHTSAEVDYEL